MEDIGEKLYELIQAEFEQLTARDVRLIGLSARIERGTATTRDISEYSLRLGTHLRTAIEHNVSADVLPNGRMYYNIADKILDRSLRNTYELVNDVAVRIQEAVDKQQDIHIRPQKAEYPVERVRAAIGAASALDITAEKMIRRMGSPAENITASFADDYMQVNAEFRSKSGMQAYIIRDDHSGCCPWCSKQAGKYAYPDNVPQDVYRRHDNCKCTVEYVTNGRKQNVHTKQQSMISPEDRKRMAALSEKGSVRLSPEEAAAAENKALEVMAQKSGRMLTDGAELQAAEPRFKFIEAKNLEEAQAYAQQFCESSFMAKNFKGVVDYKGISVENANKINRALTDVYNRVELDKLSGIKTVAPGSALGKKAFKDGADAVFSYDPIQHGIYINKDIQKNEKTFAEYVKRSDEAWDTVMGNIDKLSGSQKELALLYKEAGRSLVDGDTVEGMFTHELGHHAQWTLLDAKTNNSVGDRMKDYAPKLSGYANASKSEYLAESFGAYMRGETDILDPEYVRFINSKSIDKSTNRDIIKLRINMFDKSDPIYLDALSIEEEIGFEDIHLHGSPSAVQIVRNGQPMNLNVDEFVLELKSNGYVSGDIRLCSCSTGQGENSFAQQLSAKLGNKVKAPNDDLYYIPNEGILFVGSEYTNTGAWRIFDKGVEIFD